jgi:hypothetical protein
MDEQIPWGKEWKWGIVKRRDELVAASKRGDRRYVLHPYAVVENSEAAFTTLGRQVALNLTYDEASALCAILNTGETK